ncbi:hypothetical protein QBC34DRAFT_408002 [Podospora aff. communis PSN243]|uniref:Uncharacterized protein n=1 Tax=Podospora aff. communis PSN243 TaxID=3040156 RepID=A0AAV9GHN9_9PEZI|nr:hypothetical protein QBC34DRAFT_408002 [Podospora aff. communis PSN243]
MLVKIPVVVANKTSIWSIQLQYRARYTSRRLLTCYGFLNMSSSEAQKERLAYRFGSSLPTDNPKSLVPSAPAANQYSRYSFPRYNNPPGFVSSPSPGFMNQPRSFPPQGYPPPPYPARPYPPPPPNYPERSAITPAPIREHDSSGRYVVRKTMERGSRPSSRTPPVPLEERYESRIQVEKWLDQCGPTMRGEAGAHRRNVVQGDRGRGLREKTEPRKRTGASTRGRKPKEEDRVEKRDAEQYSDPEDDDVSFIRTQKQRTT